MGPGGVGVADAVDHRHLALVVELLEGAHGGSEAKLIVHLDDLVLLVVHGGAVVVVQALVVGDHRVEIVVAAGELQHHDDWVFLGRGHAIAPFFPSFQLSAFWFVALVEWGGA